MPGLHIPIAKSRPSPRRAGERAGALHALSTAPENLGREIAPRAPRRCHPALTELGRVAYSVTPSGLLFPYYAGCFAALDDCGLLTEDSFISGSSGGALIAVLCMSGMSSDEIRAGCVEAQTDLIENGCFFRIVDVIDSFLTKFLPEDIHTRVSGRIGIAITSYDPGTFPGIGGELIQDFTSKQDLIEAVICSCQIPFWASGKFAGTFRGRMANDGLTTAFYPRLPDAAEDRHDTKITVCAVPRQSRLVFGGRPDISPDLAAVPLLSSFDFIRYALMPAPVSRVGDMFSSGYNDTHNWADALILEYERAERAEREAP